MDNWNLTYLYNVSAMKNPEIIRPLVPPSCCASWRNEGFSRTWGPSVCLGVLMLRFLVDEDNLEMIWIR